MTTILYGISNCDTIKKAKRFLENNNVEYTFHDYRKDGIDNKLLNKFLEQLEWTDLLNKRGTTWRNLDDSIKDNINKTQAQKTMLEQPAIIKRPVLLNNGKYYLGFSETEYKKII